MRRTKEDAAKTKASILEAALKVFHRRGVTRASLSEVAQEAGVTRGAIYWHFKDKLELYFTLYDTLTEEFSYHPSEYTDQSYESLDAFKADIRRSLEYFEQNERYRMFMQLVFSRVEYIEELSPVIDNEREKQYDLVRAYENALTDLQYRGFVSSRINCKQYAFILFSFADGVLDSWGFDVAFFSGETSVGLLLDELFNPLRP